MLIGYFCEFPLEVFNPGFGINVFLSIMLLLLIEPGYPLAFAKYMIGQYSVPIYSLLTHFLNSFFVF